MRTTLPVPSAAELAATVKRSLSWCEESEIGNRHREAGIAALDALLSRCEKAETEVARLRDELGAVEDERMAWESNYARLRQALRDLNDYASRMPGYSLHPLTERARAAVAGEDTA